jgi:hypothetical protein
LAGQGGIDIDGSGGNGLGGGLYNDAGATLTVSVSTIKRNSADGGAAGAGGSDGQGVGGGVYNLGTFNVDTFTVIKDNHASTSNNNIFT